MAPDDLTLPTAPNPSPHLAATRRPESLGDWVDPTDLADREAVARARSGELDERPPHY